MIHKKTKHQIQDLERDGVPDDSVKFLFINLR